jgi:hypothetical protein
VIFRICKFPQMKNYLVPTFTLVVFWFLPATLYAPNDGPLLPFELNSDLNNDGKVGEGSDSSLKTAALQSGASDEAKEKATEYVFVNDHLSNGLWDKEDPDSSRPASETKDDDAEELKTICAATWGAIWFEHPIINKLAFYKTKECNAADKLTFPFALSETTKLPEKLFVRAEEVTVQIEGDLVMKFGKADKSETWVEDKLKFTVVKEVFDKKYFHAVRDYILENNTTMFAHRKGYPADNPDTEFWICAMREETTKMEAVEAFHRGTGKLFGIGDVVSNYPAFTAVTNGNQVFFSDGWEPAPPYYFDEDHVMSDKCHGRLIYAGVSSPASSDGANTSSVPPGSPLAGPQGNYISQGTNGPFTLALGRVPNAPYPWMGLGGLSTNYGDPTRANLPQTMVGYAPVLEDGKGVVFTASQPPMGGGNSGFPSGGRAPEFAADANRSGVPAMPGAGAGRYKLLILDSGRTSVALAQVKPNNVLGVQFKGTKHSVGYPYYVNTYLGFKSTRPRPNP